MTPQRKSFQGSIPQRRLVNLETRSRSNSPAAAKHQTAPVSHVSQPAHIPKPFVAPAPSTAKTQISQVTAVPHRPRPFHQKLPSAAELAALTNGSAQPARRPHTQHQSTAVHALAQTQHGPAKVSVTPQRPRRAVQIQQVAIAPEPKPLFEQAIANEKSKPTKKPRNKIQLAFMGAGIVVFILGIAVSIISLRTNHEVAAQAKTLTQNTSDVNQAGNGDDPQPSETPIPRATVATYKVAPDAPRKLIIPKLGVDTRVLGMSLKPDGDLQTPSNIYDTGWYSSSAKPGTSGATLIDGHVHGLTAPGVFYNLKKLSKDDIILVERGDGKQIKYKVVKTQVYDANNTDMKAAVTPIVAGKSGLNLITCTGKVNLKTSTYNERLLVFATIAE